jgi:hypothetical protein
MMRRRMGREGADGEESAKAQWGNAATIRREEDESRRRLGEASRVKR